MQSLTVANINFVSAHLITSNSKEMYAGHYNIVIGT